MDTGLGFCLDNRMVEANLVLFPVLWFLFYSSEFFEGNIAIKEILPPLIRANSCPILCTHKQSILTPPVKTDL